MLGYSKSFRSIRSHTENLYDRARRKLTGSFRHNPNSSITAGSISPTNSGCSNNSLLTVQNSLFPNEYIENVIN